MVKIHAPLDDKHTSDASVGESKAPAQARQNPAGEERRVSLEEVILPEGRIAETAPFFSGRIDDDEDDPQFFVDDGLY